MSYENMAAVEAELATEYELRARIDWLIALREAALEVLDESDDLTPSMLLRRSIWRALGATKQGEDGDA